MLVAANSVPVYIEWNWYGTIENDGKYWNCFEWINWHKAMKSKYGKEAADSTWVQAWNLYTRPVFEKVPHLCASNTPEFVKYFTDEGLIDSTGNVLASIVGAEIRTANKVSGAVIDVGEGAVNIVSGAGKALGSVGTIIKYAPYVILLAIILYLAVKYKPQIKKYAAR